MVDGHARPTGLALHSRKQAKAIYQAVGIQLMTVHEDDLRAVAEQTGKFYLPDTDPSVPRRLHRQVRKARSVEDAIEPAMEIEASRIRESGNHPLRAVILYRQALSTLMELASSKYGDNDRVQEVASQLDQKMPQLLGLRA